GALGRGEELQGEGDASPQHGGRVPGAEHFLQAHGNRGRSRIAVVDGYPRTGRRLEMCWRELVEPSTLIPIKHSEKCGRDVQGPQRACRTGLTQRAMQLIE